MDVNIYMESTGEPITLHVGHSVKERRIDKYLHNRFNNFSLPDQVDGAILGERYVEVDAREDVPSSDIDISDV